MSPNSTFPTSITLFINLTNLKQLLFIIANLFKSVVLFISNSLIADNITLTGVLTS